MHGLRIFATVIISLVAANKLVAQTPECMIYCGACNQMCIAPGAFPSAPVVSALTTNSLTLSWPFITGASYYEVSYSVNSGAFQVYDNYNSATNSVSLINLSPGNRYSLKVQGVRCCKTVDGPETRSSTSATVEARTFPLTPTLNEAASSAHSTSIIDFVWNGVTGEGYLLDISASKIFATFVALNTNIAPASTTNFTTAGLSPGTNYFYRVRAYNGLAISAYSAASMEIPTLPAAPTVSTPQQITTNSMKVSWTTINGNATSYKLDVSTSPAFDTFVTGFNARVVAGTTEDITGLSAGTQYYIRVRAFTTSATSANSSVSVKTLPVAPNLLSPSGITTSSFLASWDAVFGADSYQVDVATSNSFAPLVSVQTNLSVNGTTRTIAGLASGTSYFYRVQAVNASGASGESNIQQLITIPAAPVLRAASDVTTNSFTANWDQTTGAVDYRLDVSTSQDFSTRLPSFDDFTVVAPGTTVSGLTPGTLYYSRVRAVNLSGTSPNPAGLSVITIPLPPEELHPDEIHTTSFSVDWTPSTGAAGYRVDVATDESFSTLLTAYTNLSIPGPSVVVSGLASGTPYYIRVKAFNDGGTSVATNGFKVTTLPETPGNIHITHVESNSISLGWDPVFGASAYLLEASTSEFFESLLEGYNPKAIAGFTSHVIQDLSPHTIYYFRIRSKNVSGTSEGFAVLAGSTANADGSIPTIEISNPVVPNVHETGTAAESISINARGGLGTLSVFFYHRKRTSNEFVKETLAKGSGDLYTTRVDETWLDLFGMDYYFQVNDLGGSVKREPAGDAYHSVLSGVPGFNIPVSSFGQDMSNYRIISFPYTLSKSRIEEIMVPIMGEYDKTRWRFVHYDNGDNRDYLDGLRISDVTQGQSYWFISKDAVELRFDHAVAYDNSVDRPFVMQLKEGWNQVGNPFSVDLNWSEIRGLAVNAGVSAGSLLSFDPSNMSFIESDDLAAYGGGFVFADQNSTLTIPVTLAKGASTGRHDSSVAEDSFNMVDDRNWLLQLTVSQGQLSNGLAGIGMHELATEGKDVYDKVTPPRFMHYVELNSYWPGYRYPMSQNVIDRRQNHTWKYDLASNSDEAVVLRWDSRVVRQLGGRLIVHDVASHTVADMSRVSELTITPGTSLSITFNATESPMPFDRVVLGVPYPNPFYNELTIPFESPAGGSSVSFSLTDLNGKELFNKKMDFESIVPTVQCVAIRDVADIGAELSPGVYVYRLEVATDGGVNDYKGIVVKQ